MFDQVRGNPEALLSYSTNGSELDSEPSCHGASFIGDTGLKFDGGTAAICRRALATGRNAL